MQRHPRWNDWIGYKDQGCCHYYQSIQRNPLFLNFFIMLEIKQGYILKKFKDTEQFFEMICLSKT